MFTRITILFFAVITILCLLFMSITYLSVSNFHQASTQLLNKEVATHIAKFTSPFKEGGIDKKKADSVFYDAMVLSPSAEVYFLDTAGKVIAFHANEKNIKEWMVPLENIKKLIASGGNTYIKSADPREPGYSKIFSASEVWDDSGMLGYIYVILGSNKNVTGTLYTSYFSGLVIKVVIVIIVFSILFSFFYIGRLRNRFNRMLTVLQKFQGGDFTARFHIQPGDELAPVTTAFNTMADMLVVNIDKLTKTGKERKDFVANISHDLRTPLSIARGYTETLLMKKNNVSQNEQEEFLQLVYRKIMQVEHMVKQLFDLSKMESIEFTPKKEPFIFSEILQEIIQESTAFAGEKHITVHADYGRDASWIFADIGMMERLIQNLFVNAVKYTPAHGEISVSLQKEDEMLVLKMQNTGEMLNAQLVKWFNDVEAEVFNNRPANSGLGLVIVKKILQLHNYAYKVITKPGPGNTFIIEMHIHYTVIS